MESESERIEKLYELAWEANWQNDTENALKYYRLIKRERPTDWKANFYVMYFQSVYYRNTVVVDEIKEINDYLPIAFKCIKKRIYPASDIIDVGYKVYDICDTANQRNKRILIECNNAAFGIAKIMLKKIAPEYCQRAMAIVDLLLTCGDLIEQDYESNDTLMKIACMLWKTGIETWKEAYAIYADHADRYSVMKTQYVEKLMKYQSGYSFEAPSYIGFPLTYVGILRGNSDRDFGITSDSRFTKWLMKILS